MVDPYESPNSATIRPVTQVTDEIVQRLNVGDRTETIAIYNVSDCHLYGSKHRRQLSGAAKKNAESAKCDPVVYQSVYWCCFVFLPVWPLGTYFVIPCVECDDPDGDADQYRGIRTDWDTRQIIFHYAVMFTLILTAGIVAWWLWN